MKEVTLYTWFVFGEGSGGFLFDADSEGFKLCILLDLCKSFWTGGKGVCNAAFWNPYSELREGDQTNQRNVRGILNKEHLLSGCSFFISVSNSFILFFLSSKVGSGKGASINSKDWTCCPLADIVREIVLGKCCGRLLELEFSETIQWPELWRHDFERISLLLFNCCDVVSIRIPFAISEF